jgi:AcrR family transcriptional regulator
MDRSRKSRKSAAPVGEARDRILQTAYELFTRYGVQTVGVDRIVAEAGVAKSTLYRHFPAKQDLVLATLDLREQLWTRDWLQREVERRGRTPEERLLSVFDAFDEWFHRSDYEGCFFAKTILEEYGTSDAIVAAGGEKLANVRELIAKLADEAGVRDPAEFARRLQQLMLGSIVAAVWGDREAARSAKAVATIMLRDEQARAS